ncbi:MAG: 3-hydroxyacyl-CoA dehydrogenase [Rhodospirillales bacterium]|nr:3-hydroxyacyl-CoA dehydrogenase [Rhodospirillales bacterium]
MTTVACVGVGLIGRAWATIFAAAGYSVRLYDADTAAASRARGLIGAELKSLARLGLATGVARALARIKVCASLADAVGDADLVQESGPEKIDAKRTLFAELDHHAPKDTILASSSSFMVASRYTEKLKGRRRCLVAHPVNPPHLVPIVELCPAPWTAKSVVDRAEAIYAGAGQVPIRVKKETYGFVLNRLQAVLMAEAFRLVGDGVVSPQDLDKTIRDGLGLRWSFMGPFETIELNAPGGIPDYCARYAPSLSSLVKATSGGDPFGRTNTKAVVKAWRGAQTKDRIARLTRWRDQRLGALKAHKLKQAKKPA